MEYRRSIFLSLSLLCFLTACLTQGAKILLITMQAYSHCLEMASVGQELVNRGHDVAIFFDARFVHKNCYERGNNGTKKIRTILFHPGDDIKTVASFHIRMGSTLGEGKDQSVLDLLQIMNGMTWHQCAGIFSDITALNMLKAEQFDLTIVSGVVPSYCFFVLPYRLGTPYVALGVVIEDIVSTRPILSSIVPHEITTFTDKMTFLQRVVNTIAPIPIHAMVKRFVPMDVISKVAPELSTQDVINVVSKSELFLYNYDRILSYPVPTMPNHILVGGVTAQSAVPLTGLFKDFYQEARHGVVVVSFGSILDSLPSAVTNKLMAVLSKLDIAILWKQAEEGRHGKIQHVKWLPQNDLLGHQNTRLFVSHCGNNGVFEALYHGVPLVCTPLYGDQFYHAIRVERWGAGISVSLMTSSEENLFNAISEVLTNSTYKTNMLKASAIYHSRPQNARERAAFWIEHVLKFGGGHLRSPAADMSVFVYRGYDVLCFLFVCGFLVIFLTTKILLVICRWGKNVKLRTN